METHVDSTRRKPALKRSVKSLLSELSQTIRGLTDGIERIETILIDTVQHLNEDDVDSTSDNGEETQVDQYNRQTPVSDHDLGRDDSGSIRAADTQRYDKFLVCPEKRCQNRKPDRGMRQFIRHYEIHVPCAAKCTMCYSMLHNVAAFKRHFRECPFIKQSKAKPECHARIAKMKDQLDLLSSEASTLARHTVSYKRRRTESQSIDSRKKLKQSTSGTSLEAIEHDNVATTTAVKSQPMPGTDPVTNWRLSHPGTAHFQSVATNAGALKPEATAVPLEHGGYPVPSEVNPIDHGYLTGHTPGAPFQCKSFRNFTMDGNDSPFAQLQLQGEPTFWDPMR